LKHVALIPARGGSTAIKNKNLQEINGKSLVKIAWDQCNNSEIFDQILISTDSKEIANEVEGGNDFNNAEVDSITKISDIGFLHKRNSDDAGIYSLISELTFKIASLITHELLWIIQPTAPFRSKNEFEELKLITERELEWSSIISVKDAETVHPLKMFFLNHFLSPVITLDIDDSQPRQLLPKVCIKDGAFYILKAENLKNRIFLGDKILPFIRSTDINVNIDNPEDLEIARFLYKDYT